MTRRSWDLGPPLPLSMYKVKIVGWKIRNGRDMKFGLSLTPTHNGLSILHDINLELIFFTD